MAIHKPKETYRETYRKGVTIRQELLPDRFPFTAEGWVVESIEMMAAGCLNDGREFQEIRIFTREIRAGEPVARRHNDAPIPLVPGT